LWQIQTVVVVDDDDDADEEFFVIPLCLTPRSELQNEMDGYILFP